MNITQVRMERPLGANLSAFAVLLTAAVTYFGAPEVDQSLQISTSSSISEEYDFVVVGSGTAGSIVASRLSEMNNWTVLLIEAGGPQNPFSYAPAVTYDLWFTDMDWNYTTMPQSNACLVVDGRCIMPRGRVIGGTGVVTDLVYVRGNRWDYDNWASMGNEGWSYADVLPYFLRNEDNLNYGPPYHSNSGPMIVTQCPFLTPLTPAYLRACNELDYPTVDINGEDQIGVNVAQVTLRHGRRLSTAAAYLIPANHRPNLSVISRGLVTKVNINTTTKVAEGVQLTFQGTSLNVKARKEVILSAGVFNTPQILMLSGVGPRSVLNSLDIPLIQDLSVGENLHDHVGPVLPFVVNQSVTVNWDSIEGNATGLVDYAKNGAGPITTMGVEAIGFLNFTNQSQTQGVPDLEVLFISWVPTNQDGQIFAVFPFNLHPRSRGSVRIQSSNPTVPPLIDPRYLTEPEDLAAAIRAAQIGLQLSQTSSLQAFGTTLAPLPLCSSFSSETDLSRCIATNYSATVYHPVGTCKMGPANDTNAVVDPRLRVYGIKNLRVIDASIIPQIVSGNINAPVMMIAERASDLIKQDYSGSK